jgi:uncharacterized protein
MFIVMAKKPGATAKTRLASALDERTRTELAAAFIVDKAHALCTLMDEPRIVVAPPDPPEALRALVGPAVSLRAQQGADLGERLCHAAAEAFAEGATWVALVDADTPTLPIAYLREAMNALQCDGGAQVALGPARDGGYYLIGMRAMQRDLFEGIPWSTPSVFADTVAKLGDRSLHVLPEWYDVDTPAELATLRDELSSMGTDALGYPAATARVLQRTSIIRVS